MSVHACGTLNVSVAKVALRCNFGSSIIDTKRVQQTFTKRGIVPVATKGIVSAAKKRVSSFRGKVSAGKGEPSPRESGIISEARF